VDLVRSEVGGTVCLEAQRARADVQVTSQVTPACRRKRTPRCHPPARSRAEHEVAARRTRDVRSGLDLPRECTMQVLVHTDRNIDGHEALVDEVSAEVTSALNHFSDGITRVEVHLSDENSDKKGGKDDKRCLMEARLEGRQPIAVTFRAATLSQAVRGAADNLASIIETTLGRTSHAIDSRP
jgi:Sigma 54 modulation protein / S30EA ribosomal protein